MRNEIKLTKHKIYDSGFFRDQKEFRQWLEKNHNKESELLVGYFKSGSGKPNMTRKCLGVLY